MIRSLSIKTVALNMELLTQWAVIMVPSGLKLLNNRTREKVLKESEIVLVFQHSNNKSQNLRQETTRVNVEHNFPIKFYSVYLCGWRPVVTSECCSNVVKAVTFRPHPAPMCNQYKKKSLHLHSSSCCTVSLNLGFLDHHSRLYSSQTINHHN